MRYIIITGATRGIGRDLALLFAQQEQNHVLALSRDQTKLDQLADEAAHLAGQLTTSAFDLRAKPDAALGDMVKAWGNIDILINNAGLLYNKPFAALTSAEMAAMWETNVQGPAQLIQALLPYLGKGKTKSHIVNVGSMGGFQGSSKFPGLSVYSATKAALASLTECLAEELKEQHIALNCLALGAVQTEMLAEAFPGYTPPTTSQEMSSYIHWFALEGHRYFNGKVLPVSVSTP